MSEYDFSAWAKISLGQDPKQIIDRFCDFEKADDDFDPICLKGKTREQIKLDLVEITDK